MDLIMHDVRNLGHLCWFYAVVVYFLFGCACASVIAMVDSLCSPGYAKTLEKLFPSCPLLPCIPVQSYCMIHSSKFHSFEPISSSMTVW